MKQKRSIGFVTTLMMSLLWTTTLPSCQTKSPDNNRIKAAAPSFITDDTDPSLGEEPQQQPTGCDQGPTVCTEEFNPSVCSAYVYDGKRLPDELAHKGWGANPCLAKDALRRTLCEYGKSPQKMAEVECVPDVTQGRCPPAREVCTLIYQPSRCEARSYDGQTLSFATRPIAWGGNECDATRKLQNLACQLNLDPEKLAEVSCERSRASCPPAPPDCDASDQRQMVCRQIIAGETVEVVATSACEAKWRLARLSCGQVSARQGNGLGRLDIGEVSCGPY